MDNRHAHAIPVDTISQVKEHLTQVKQLLEPYSTALTLEQRKKLSKMSDKTIAFGGKALEHATNHPEFLPAHINLNDWKIDMADVNNLKQIMVLVADLDQMTDDARLIAGNEAYFASRGYYHSVQRAASDGVLGAKPIYDDLKVNFTNRKSTATTKKIDN